MQRKEFSVKERKAALRKGESDRAQTFGARYTISDDELDALGLGRFKPEDKENFLAILPNPTAPIFYHRIWSHDYIGPEGDSFLCPRKMSDQYCPVCAYRDQIVAEIAAFESEESLPITATINFL